VTATLWHIEFSHYNEKARWALDYKGIEHERRAPLPGVGHISAALWLTHGRQVTLPVLELDGERIGDSTAIIAALEQRYPEPPLYPSDPAERRRALELEEWFDEELGPHLRRLLFHELCRDRERFHGIMASAMPPAVARMKGVGYAYVSAFTALRFGAASKAGAELARGKVIEALDRLEAELFERGEYLVGERFTVADLTAAALFYPLVVPPEGPMQVELPPRGFERFREPLIDRPGFRWVEEMFRRHRKPVAESAPPLATPGRAA
jgi:glutathione S-transferase